MRDEETDDEREGGIVDPRLLDLLGSPNPGMMTPDLAEEVKVEPREDRNDYETSREGLHELLGKTMTAINDLMGVARQSQHPRAFEVLNQLIKTAAETNEQLLDIAKKKKDLEKVEPAQGDQPGVPRVQHNTLVVTSEQMLQMMRDKMKAITVDDGDTGKAS